MEVQETLHKVVQAKAVMDRGGGELPALLSHAHVAGGNPEMVDEGMPSVEPVAPAARSPERAGNEDTIPAAPAPRKEGVRTEKERLRRHESPPLREGEDVAAPRTTPCRKESNKSEAGGGSHRKRGRSQRPVKHDEVKHPTQGYGNPDWNRHCWESNRHCWES